MLVFQSSFQDPDAKKAMDDDEADWIAAQEALKEIVANARADYDATPDPKPPFEQWLGTYPPYTAAKRLVNSTKTIYNQAFNAYLGPIKTLQRHQEHVTKALDSENSQLPYVGLFVHGLNMPVTGGETAFAASYT